MSKQSRDVKKLDAVRSVSLEDVVTVEGDYHLRQPAGGRARH